MPAAKALRIAVLLDHIESDYHAALLAGVLRAARASRVRTLIVPGGWLGASAQHSVTRNFIFDLLPRARLDGYLIMGGSLANHCGPSMFREWLRRFEPTPCLVVGLDLPGVCNVRVDNVVGMRAAVTHLIEGHERRRIAFISGPAESAEAQQRLRAYVEALRDHGIVVDERLIVPGGFGRADGIEGVVKLLDERHFTPATLDAIVAANDSAALGALEELHRRGLSVPDAISVVGFDDAPTARAANPPLTTVNQKVEVQGFAATRALIDSLEGKRPLQNSMLPPELVVRASCGCITQFENDSGLVRPAPVSLARSCRLALVERHRAITAELSRAAQGHLLGMPGWEGRLLDALTQDLATPSGNGFVRQWERLVRKHVALGHDVMTCHAILTTLRLQALACASIEPALRPRIEDLCQESRLTLARIGAEVERDRHLIANVRMRFITRSCLALLDSGNLVQLAATLDEHLPMVGISTFMVTQFREGHGMDDLDVVARRTTRLGATAKSVVPTSELGLDSALEQEDAVVIEPLEIGARPLGIGAFAWGASVPVHYEQLRELLSAALCASSLRRDRAR